MMQQQSKNIPCGTSMTNYPETRRVLIVILPMSIFALIYFYEAWLKVSLFQHEILMSKIFQNCNEKIVRISAQKSKKSPSQTNKDILLCQIAPN